MKLKYVLPLALLSGIASWCADGELNEDPHAKIEFKGKREVSGMIRAAKPNEFWGHHDKGNDPELFRFHENGKVLQRIVFTGLKNDDWEAITRDPQGRLYIGAIGDNDRKKDMYRIIRFTEPSTRARSLTRYDLIEFQYPAGKSHNAEALFWFDNGLYVITKVDEDERPEVFRVDAQSSGARTTARPVGRSSFEGTVTDAAYSDKHRLLVILTYSKLHFLRVDSEADLLQRPLLSIHIDFGQCEGVCFDEGELIVSNEKGGLWKYPVAELLLHVRY